MTLGQDDRHSILLGDLADDELSAYIERIATLQRKQVGLALGTAMLMFIPLGLVFVMDDVGIPALVVFGGLAAVFIACIPPLVRNWKLDLSRLEAVVELTERGLEAPEGTRMLPTDPAALEMNRRASAPMALGGASMLVALVSIVLLFGGLLSDAWMVLVMAAITYAAFFMVIVSMVWIVVVAVRVRRPKVEAPDDGPVSPA